MAAAAQGPRGLVVGRVAGAPVVIARSWFVILVVVVLLFAPGVPTTSGDPALLPYAVATGYALLLLASVFVHEVAHAVAARSVGTPAQRIVLDLWGGHTQFGSEQSTPGRSFLVAVVGPLSNALLAGLAAALAPALAPDGIPRLLVGALAVANALVAGFNLVPGLPLDGGRLLEALVWRVTGSRATGTVAGGWGGRVAAVGLVVVVLGLPLSQGRTPGVVQLVWSGLIAYFLWSGAQAAIRHGRLWQRIPALAVRDLLRPAVGVPVGSTVADVLVALRRTGSAWAVLLDGVRAPVAVVDPAALAAVPDGRRHEVPASSTARALQEGAVMPVDLVGEGVVVPLQRSPAAEYAVVDQAGAVVGLLIGADVVARLQPRR